MIHALHGNLGMPDDFRPLLDALQRPFHAWHLWQWIKDQPQPASLQGFAAALNSTVEEQGGPPRVLLGYSLGGRLALHALTQHSATWDAAVIISAHPGLRGETERSARHAQDRSWAERFLRESSEDVMAAWDAQAVFSLTGRSRRKEAHSKSGAGESEPPHVGCYESLETWRKEISRAFDIWSLGRQDDLRQLLPSVTCPVLWLTGERDEKFTALAAEVCSQMPDADHAIIPDAGHRVHLDQPDATAAAIASFLITAGC